jgi:hypothetical protein
MSIKVKMTMWKLSNSFPELTFSFGYTSAISKLFKNKGYIHDGKNGTYISGKVWDIHFIWVRDQGDTYNSLKTLFHEVGHYLCDKGFSYDIAVITPKGFEDLIPQAWINHYSLDVVVEEITVECFALWAMSLYKQTGKFHPDFVKFMRKMSKALR